MTQSGLATVYEGQYTIIKPQTYPKLIIYSLLPYGDEVYGEVIFSPYVWINSTLGINDNLYNSTASVIVSALNGVLYATNITLSENSSAIWLPYYTNRYNLSAPQSITITTSSNATSPILVVKPPQNYLNTSVNATYYNASNVQKIISNMGLTSNVLLFGVIMPKYLFLLLDVILLAIIATLGIKHEAPMILALAVLVLSGLFIFSLQILALAVLLIYLAYNVEKWRI